MKIDLTNLPLVPMKYYFQVLGVLLVVSVVWVLLFNRVLPGTFGNRVEVFSDECPIELIEENGTITARAICDGFNYKFGSSNTLLIVYNDYTTAQCRVTDHNMYSDINHQCRIVTD